MKKILLFGAGKSATVLIDYLLQAAPEEKWHLVLVDAQLDLALGKLNASPHGTALSFDITDEARRREAIAAASIVISLLPPALHYFVALDCIQLKKNLLTASYVDAQLKTLAPEIEKAGLLFLCEMGLDPGIDHMSAKLLIDRIQSRNGRIVSFYSHCGGLVAPENDDNPWHYKISWNPRNVVMAGKAGAIYRDKGEIVELPYEALFAEKRYVPIPGHDVLCWYPNRDSLSYLSLYGLQDCPTFIRTTLRHPDFMYGWKNIIDLKLTSEKDMVETDGVSLSAVFKKYLEAQGFNEWLEQKLQHHFDATKGLLSELVNLVELEQKAASKGVEPVDEFMLVDDAGNLKEVDIDDLKINAAATLADKMHDASLTLKQLFYLGLDDTATMVDKGHCAIADVLQLALEKKLALRPSEKDRVVMLHEIGYEMEGKSYRLTSTLVLDGADDRHTAMAKTVGLPLGLAAKLILEGSITARGLQVPLTPDIYVPVLRELESHGIAFSEEETPL